MRRRLFLTTLLALASVLVAPAQTPPGSYDVRAFGAKADGKTLDSPAINKAIEAAAAAGGGTVVLTGGTFLSTTLRLKSNITLYLDQGATLLAADPKDGHKYDAPESSEFDQFQDFGHTFFHNSLIVGENLVNIAIVGAGTIDGRGLIRSGSQARSRDEQAGLRGKAPAGRNRGKFGYPDASDAVPEGWGNKAIALKLCRGVTLRDLTIKKGGHCGILATGVDNLTLDNLKLDVHRAGIDLDACRNVRVSNCAVNSPFDDGIALKSTFALGQVRPCENITITNCQITGYDEGTLLDGTYQRSAPAGRYAQDSTTGRLKFGAESIGGFRNITIANCVFEYSRGLALISVDGAPLEDITINNVTMRDIVNAPIYLRLGSRLRAPDGTAIGTLRRVMISNVTVTNATWEQCVIIAGDPMRPIEDVSLSNIRLHYQGGGTAEHAAIAVPAVEGNNAFPEPALLSRQLPAYGFFVRHVRGLTLNNVEVKTEKPDERPAFVFENVTDVRLSGMRVKREGALPLFSLTQTDAVKLKDVDGLADRDVGKIEIEKF